MSEHDQLLERVRKLMAKATDASVTEAEAQAFASKAAELLAAHGLAMADVPQEARDDGYESSLLDLRYHDPWRSAVVGAAARLYMCRWLHSHVQYTPRGGAGRAWRRAYMLVGRPANIDVCTRMVVYLTDTVQRLSRQYSSVRRDQLHFERACGARVASRLLERAREQQSRHDQKSAGGTTLPAVIASELDQAEAWMRANMQLGRPNRSLARPIRAGGRAAADGWAAGADVGLDPQVGGGQQRRLWDR